MKRVKRFGLSLYNGSAWCPPKFFSVVYSETAKQAYGVVGQIAQSQIGDIISIKNLKHRIVYIEWELVPEERQRRKAIKEIAEQQGVNTLVHFTRLENLASILCHGLLSVEELERREIGFERNDRARNDGHKNAICLSVSFPNYKYFYTIRNQSGGHWVVLELKADVLWQKDCAFAGTNAASGSVRKTQLEDLRAPAAFAELFGNPRLRQRLRLPDFYTTNPQAEVLVFEPIEPEYITRIITLPGEEAHVRSFLLENLPAVGSLTARSISITADERLFRGRLDWEYWRSDPFGY